MLDTHAIARSLTAADFTPAQADALTDALWTLRENVRAHLRRLVKRILRRHGYPPDKQESATRTVLEQAELLSVGTASA